MEGSILICQHNSLNSHLGLTPRIPPSTTLPIRPGPDLPQPLPLPASTPEPSQPSGFSSQQIPVPDPGLEGAPGKRGLVAGKWSQWPQQHTNLLPVGIPNSSSRRNYTFPVVPARLRREAPPGLCFRPHVSGFSFLPVSTPPQLLPTHMPLSTDILSSFLPPFLPFAWEKGSSSPPPWTS